MDTKLILSWKQGKIVTGKCIKRGDFSALFEGLTKGFRDDCEISKQLIQIIPKAESLYIDFDFIETQDIPSINYFINGEQHMLKISRYHKVIWEILNKCFS